MDFKKMFTKIDNTFVRLNDCLNGGKLDGAKKEFGILDKSLSSLKPYSKKSEIVQTRCDMYEEKYKEYYDIYTEKKQNQDHTL